MIWEKLDGDGRGHLKSVVSLGYLVLSLGCVEVEGQMALIWAIKIHFWVFPDNRAEV